MKLYGRKVVEIKDTDGEIVVEALSFYYPRFYKQLKGNIILVEAKLTISLLWFTNLNINEFVIFLPHRAKVLSSSCLALRLKFAKQNKQLLRLKMFKS